MNIIIPIAGANKPSAETEYIKSLQEIERKTVLQYVFESLQALKTDHFIVVIKREDASKYHLDHIVRLLRSELCAGSCGETPDQPKCGSGFLLF